MVIDMVKSFRGNLCRVGLVTFFIFLITLPQICVAKTLAKVTLSSEGTSTGLPDLFTGTFGYSIPIEVPVGRKGMDPGLALQYRSGTPNGRVGIGWDFDLGSIQHAVSSSNSVDYTQNKFLFVKSGSASSLMYSSGTLYKETIEGSFRNIQQLVAGDGKPYWVVTEKNGMRYFFGQSAQSRQDDPGNSARIFKWCLDRIEDTNGNYITCSYYKNQGQIYPDKIEYTGNKNTVGMLPTNSVNIYWETRQDATPDTTAGFSVTTAYRLSAIDVINKPTQSIVKRIRAYKLTYDANASIGGSQYSVTTRSLLYSVQQFDKNCQIATKVDINSSGLITGGSSLPAMTMFYDQTSATSQSVDYLTSFTNGIGGTTSITYSAETLVGTTLPALNISSVTGNDGNGNISTTYYHYTGGYYYTSAAENDFRGFNKVEVWGPVSDGKQTRTETYFHQGNDTAVDANNFAVGTGYTKGKPYRSTTYAVSGVTTGNESKQKVSETTTIYAQPASTLSAPYFTPPMQIDSYICDVDSSCEQSRTKYSYDNYGNVSYEEHQGDIYDATDDLTITRTYSPNTDLWIVGLPTSEETYKGIGPNNKIAGKKYYYDDINSRCAGPFYDRLPNVGNLTRVENWQDIALMINPAQIEQRIGYDSYGNVVCTLDANSINNSNGKMTTITYDPSYTYPVATTNPLGHESKIQYYGVNEQTPSNLGNYGQQKNITDPNSATVIKEYDSFGRQTKETQPDGTFVTRIYNNLGTVASQNIRSQTSDGIWSEKYFDGLGRSYFNRSIAAESKTVEAKAFYDARGVAIKTSSPYFSLETPSNVLTSYDEIGRVIKTGLQSPESTRTLTCYSKDAKVTIDPNNHRRREV